MASKPESAPSQRGKSSLFADFLSQPEASCSAHSFFVDVQKEVVSSLELQELACAPRAEPGLLVRLQGCLAHLTQRRGCGALMLSAEVPGRGVKSQKIAFSYGERLLGKKAAETVKEDATVKGAEMILRVPRQVLESFDSRLFVPVLTGWLSSALGSLGQGGEAVGLMLKRSEMLPDGSFLAARLEGEAEAITERLGTHVGLLSLTSAIMFIGSMRGLNKHSTAMQGNRMGMVATALGILSVLAAPGFHGAQRFMLTFLVAGVTGYGVAMRVRMEDMPQLIALFHSGVGLAAVCTGFASFLHPAPFSVLKAAETIVGTAVGALTFTGSLVAAGKLHGSLPGRPLVLEQRWPLNIGLVGASALLSCLMASPSVYASGFGTAALALNTAIWGGLGTLMVLPIGGADMPVVVSLLNAFSGLATSAAGFMLSNQLLTITGALVASSGTLLSDIMCRGINRSMANVLLGGFGTEGGEASGSRGPVEPVIEVSPLGLLDLLFNAKQVLIVPGYGLAVARCQQRLGEIVALLRRHNVHVHFAIHPVAGRLPGHMNVLLAEADVPYDIIKEMDEIDPAKYDVSIVIGANDIVNPATQTDPSSPIYGMPAIEVWKAKTCVVLKRSMGTGYSGVENPLFHLENVRMLFGDARSSVDTVFHLLQESEERFMGGGADLSPENRQLAAHREDFPTAERTVGVLRERWAGEQRVSVTPGVIAKFRRMGFSILLESGAGQAAGFADTDYLQEGGVQVVESAAEVLRRSDVLLKATAPMLDELAALSASQTIIGFWSMFGAEELTEALGRSQAAVVNLSLVPRISRAQKMDALSSMANIAGYRAVVDAFNRLPRFSRSSVTASGVVPPAKVLIIGAGVAGLSAIATAHALGAKVYANDVRDAAREQVESMGAEFVPVDAVGVAGEGVGGYATEMGRAFKEAQLATYARLVPTMDIVICTALIPNRPAPLLLTREMLQGMSRGSVVVDLAAASGGNCELTQKDQVEVTPEGVIVVGETNYPSSMPEQASEMLGNNFAALLETLGGGFSFGGEHWQDPIIEAATLSRAGQVLWPKAAPAPVRREEEQQPRRPVEVAPLPPPETSQLLQWLEEHKAEIAMALGSATMLGLGLATNIPEEELTHIGYFVLSCLIGHFTVAGVTPALHTPLMSVTNAISGIIVVGGMLQLSGPLLSARVACALAAVFLSSVNIVGGFAVTHRMLQMFKPTAA